MNQHENDMSLLPIMNPLYNLREICKQVTLLEDHLNQPRKRCPDCIRKHFLTIEALFEEAVSLDKELKYGEHLDGKAQEIRALQGAWLDFKDTDLAHKGHLLIAQTLRVMRKSFASICFDVRKMASIEKKAKLFICKHSSSLGDCYEANGRHFMSYGHINNHLKLVHGEVMGQGPLEGISYGHCWCEDNNTVYDYSNGRSLELPKKVYYLMGKIDSLDNLYKYNIREFNDKVLKFKHWGPWDLKTRSGL